MEFIIEKTMPEGYYKVVGRYKTFDDASNALEKIKSDLRHEIWCDDWVNTKFGYAPLAWIN